MLGLDPYSRHMSLPVLRAIHKLVEDGAVVAGPKPTDDPSLADDQAEFKKLHPSCLATAPACIKWAKARSMRARIWAMSFDALQCVAGLRLQNQAATRHVEFVHRKLTDGDLYFVDNRSDHDERLMQHSACGAQSRSCGTRRRAQMSLHRSRLRRAHHCATAPGALGHGVCCLPQADNGNFAHSPARDRDENCRPSMARGKLAFQPGRGAPDSITLDKLASWSDSTDPGVKYFSGIGTYTKTLQAHRLVHERARICGSIWAT